MLTRGDFTTAILLHTCLCWGSRAAVLDADRISLIREALKSEPCVFPDPIPCPLAGNGLVWCLATST